MNAAIFCAARRDRAETQLSTRPTVTIPLPHIAVDGFAPYTGLVVIVAMLFGGGARQGLWSDVVVQLAALPLLGWAKFRLAPSQLTGSARWGVILLFAILALPLLQLIPLPPAAWSALPGRGQIVSAYRAAGMTLPWLPLSLDPGATWRNFLSLLPAAAIFLAMLSVSRTVQRAIILILLVFAFISVPLDLLQVAGGKASPLRFYLVTNEDRAVGFFANANHSAALLYCAIPFAVAWIIALVRDRNDKRFIYLLLLPLLLIAIFIGLPATRSRAGLALAFLAGLLCIALVWRQVGGRLGRRPLLYAVAVNLAALLIAFQFGFVGLAQKAENADIMQNIRWPAASITLQAAREYFPFGAGLGTFVPIFQSHEPRSLVWQHWLNHAHDDWLELWLTGRSAGRAACRCFPGLVCRRELFDLAPPGAGGSQHLGHRPGARRGDRDPSAVAALDRRLPAAHGRDLRRFRGRLRAYSDVARGAVGGVTRRGAGSGARS